MSVPKRRQTSSRSKRRRSHDAVSAKNLVACKGCEAKRVSHHACEACGTYGDRKVAGVKKAKA